MSTEKEGSVPCRPSAPRNIQMHSGKRMLRDPNSGSGTEEFGPVTSPSRPSTQLSTYDLSDEPNHTNLWLPDIVCPNTSFSLGVNCFGDFVVSTVKVDASSSAREEATEYCRHTA